MTSFFCNDAATTEIDTDLHTLSLHDALPIRTGADRGKRHGDDRAVEDDQELRCSEDEEGELPSSGSIHDATVTDCLLRNYLLLIYAERVGTFRDRKSTRLNSSH